MHRSLPRTKSKLRPPSVRIRGRSAFHYGLAGIPQRLSECVPGGIADGAFVIYASDLLPLRLSSRQCFDRVHMDVLDIVLIAVNTGQDAIPHR